MILLTTNPIDDATNEDLLTTTINSLKDLGPQNNFVIKLHP